MEFCKQFNAQTQKLEKGLPIPTVITVYSDRSFTFVMKTPPAAVLIRKAIGIEKGSGTPNTAKVGKISRKQLEEIAKMKTTRPDRRRPGRRGPHHRGQRPQHGRRRGRGVSHGSRKADQGLEGQDHPRQAVPGGRGPEAGQGIRHRQVPRGGRCGREPRHRRQQVRPAGARLDRDAARHRQDACAWRCSPPARTRSWRRRPARTSSVSRISPRR